MTLNVGVIGVGMIGQDHIRRLTAVLAGANVVAVSDLNAALAKEVASRLPAAKVYPTGEELIAGKEVSAVVVTSLGPTHAAYVLAAIRRGSRSSARSRSLKRRPSVRPLSTPRSLSGGGWFRSASCAGSTRSAGR
jgi:hypothetical protein